METTLTFFTATILNWYNLLVKDEIKQIVIESLKFLVENKRLVVYCFVIMPNHIHIIADSKNNDNDSINEDNIIKKQVKETPFASLLKYTGHKLKKYLKDYPDILVKFKVSENDRNYRFWQNRPHHINLYSRNVIHQKMGYIHNNPLQDKWSLVDFAEEYFYSSAKFYKTGIDDFGILTHISEGNYW